METAQPHTDFVGRDRELGELVQALGSARTGRGGVVLIGGEPGIGKSRLADELAARAVDLGHDVLWGRGWEEAGAPPYWPWVQILRALLRSRGADEVRRHLDGHGADVAHILPELRGLIEGLPEPAETVSESARFQLFDSTATLLRNAAQERPLLIVFDDLQAADTPSILLLRFLSSQMSDVSALLVGTYRDIELTPDHPLTAAIAEVARERSAHLITLRGLATEAVGAYIRGTVRVDQEQAVAAAVWRQTSGNPLFLGEAVRLLADEGTLQDLATVGAMRIAVPSGIRAVIARRVRLLSDRTAELLALGATVGPEFGFDVLRLIAELPPDVTLEAVDEALDAGLLVNVTGALGRYRFSHDLVRETMYDELPIARRVRIHQRIAEALEELYGPDSESHLAELAFHFVQAAEPGRVVGGDESATVATKAIDYARRAGDAATRSLAFEESARLYRMALRVLEADERHDAVTRAELLMALGDAEARAGNLDSARSGFLRATDVARQVGSGEMLARAALGYGGRHQWARPGKDRLLVPLLEQALASLGDGDSGLRCRVLTRLACAWRSSPERRADSDRMSAEAVEIAKRLGDADAISYTLGGRFWATWWPENPEARQDLSREMVSLAETLNDGETMSQAHLMHFLSLTELGLIAEAHAELELLIRVVEETRQPAQLWLEQVNQAELALLEGDYTLAESLIAQELASTYLVTPGRDDVSAARMHRFLLRREQGRVAEEEMIVRASVSDFPWYPMHRAALACLLAEMGREDEARAVFDDLAVNRFEALYRDNEWLLGTSLASDACSLLGDVPGAQVLYEQLLPFEGRHAVGHAEGSVGSVDRYLGLLAATMGRYEDADRHLTAAIGHHARMGAKPWNAHTEHDLAEVLRRRAAPGDLERAADLDGSALRTATRLGMALAQAIAGEPTDGGGAGAEQPNAPGTEDSHASPTRPASVPAATLRREGEYWTIEFGQDSFKLRDAKGLHHLSRLLSAPGTEVHALDLAQSHAAASADMDVDYDPDLAVRARDDAGPALDSKAKAAYRLRLTELREDLDEAASWNDPERASRLQAEMDALTHELGAAVGLGGRDRLVSSAAERARVSVTRAIKAALGRIEEHSAGLGAHLRATIRTGTFCSYNPDPRAPITWEI